LDRLFINFVWGLGSRLQRALRFWGAGWWVPGVDLWGNGCLRTGRIGAEPGRRTNPNLLQFVVRPSNYAGLSGVSCDSRRVISLSMADSGDCWGRDVPCIVLISLSISSIVLVRSA